MNLPDAPIAHEGFFAKAPRAPEEDPGHEEDCRAARQGHGLESGSPMKWDSELELFIASPWRLPKLGKGFFEPGPPRSWTDTIQQQRITLPRRASIWIDGGKRFRR
jgi:hypothetical protein